MIICKESSRWRLTLWTRRPLFEHPDFAILLSISDFTIFDFSIVQLPWKWECAITVCNIGLSFHRFRKEAEK